MHNVELQLKERFIFCKFHVSCSKTGQVYPATLLYPDVRSAPFQTSNHYH